VQEADLDRRLEFNAAYQAERASSFYLQTPLRAGPMQPAQPASP
jgi:hypothetical protein